MPSCGTKDQNRLSWKIGDLKAIEPNARYSNESNHKQKLGCCVSKTIFLYFSFFKTVNPILQRLRYCSEATDTGKTTRPNNNVLNLWRGLTQTRAEFVTSHVVFAAPIAKPIIYTRLGVKIVQKATLSRKKMFVSVSYIFK